MNPFDSADITFYHSDLSMTQVPQEGAKVTAGSQGGIFNRPDFMLRLYPAYF